MKKLKFNSMLDHKQSDYKTREIIVEKVITLYGKSFSELKNHPLSDNQYIAQNRELMYIDSNDTAHCLLMVDYFNLSAEQGNEYAQNILDNMELFEHQMLANTLFGLFINLSCYIEDDYQRKFQSGRKMIDSKLRRMMQEKKQSFGIKQEHGQVQEY